MVDINDFIAKCYNEIKAMLQGEWRKKSQAPFNEDLFHDTLMKCIDTFQNTDEKTNIDFKLYIRKAFILNFLREKNYHRNSKDADIDLETLKNITYDKSAIDKDIILDYVKNNYPELQYQQFEDWSNGYTIMELNKKYGCLNARYYIDIIKQDVKEFFQNDFQN